MRAIWSGSISFVLVNIPVKLYSASQEQMFDFTLLHEKDFSPIRYARVCKVEEKEIPYEEITRGYEYQKNRYVVITPEEITKADVTKSSSIAIQSFADVSGIDPVYFEKPYYLEPDEGAEKSYALLRETLERAGKVGIAKFVMRGKEHIAVLAPRGNVLVLNQLRYQSELRESGDLKLPSKEEVSENELSIALELVEKLTKPFSISDFKDTYSTEIQRIIDEKISGKIPSAKGEAPIATPVPDLMKALKASLEKK